MKSKIKKCISSSVENFTRIFDDRDILDQIERIVLLCIERYKSDNKILFCGNGGSAADCQHFAAELVCTYKNRYRKPYKAIALTTDTSIITAWSNDLDFDTIFSRQIQAFEGITGLSIGLSTSGTSKNVIKLQLLFFK